MRRALLAAGLACGLAAPLAAAPTDQPGDAQRPALSAMTLLGALAPVTPPDLAPHDCPRQAIQDLNDRSQEVMRSARGQQLLGWIRLRIHTTALGHLLERNPGISQTGMLATYRAVLERPLEACSVAIRNQAVNAIASVFDDGELAELTAPAAPDVTPRQPSAQLRAAFRRLSEREGLFGRDGLDLAGVEAVGAVLQHQASALQARGIEP